MKILITSDSYTPSVNGVVTSVLNLREQLISRGHDVRVLTLSPDSSSWKADGVYYIKSYEFNIYPGIRGTHPHSNCFMEELLEWCPDVIHTQCEFFTMHFAKKIAKALEIPIVHTYHTMYDHYVDYLIPTRMDKSRIVGVVLREVMRNIDAIIAPTKKAMLSLEGYGIQVPMTVIPTGINLARFDLPFGEEEKAALKAKLGIAPEKKVLVTVGRLGKEKNIDETISFMSRLTQELDVVYLIVGDGPYKETLEQNVRDSGLENHVLFTGMVPGDTTWQYYKLGDLFISGSVSETQGLTYIEALASNTPLVCRKDDCLEDVLLEGENGFFYTNEEEFLSTVTRLLQNPQLQSELSQNAKDSSEKFSKENFGAAVEDFYQQILAQERVFVES